MKDIIDKASILIEALPYIQKFKGKKIVIKCGGSVLDESEYSQSFLRDVVFMNTVGMNPIIVHGGGKAITRELEKSGIKTQFVDGLRYTDVATMKIVEDILRNVISKNIEKTLIRYGAVPVLFNALDRTPIRCRKMTRHRGKPVDLGYVGEITEVTTKDLIRCAEMGEIPVVAPIGKDENAQSYNINADSLAGELAAALNVEKMVYLSDIPGILRDVKDPNSLISSLKKSEVEFLIKDKIISGGMIPKIEACLTTLDAGCKKTHIIDGRMLHSLLLEIFTDKGVGTEIVHG